MDVQALSELLDTRSFDDSLSPMLMHNVVESLRRVFPFVHHTIEVVEHVLKQ